MKRAILAAALIFILIQPNTANSEYVKHIIHHGQTLSEIAQFFDVSIGRIMAANPWIKDPDIIPAGGKLIIPLSNGRTIWLPAKIIELNPEEAKKALKDAVSEIKESMPKEMNLSRSSLKELEDIISRKMPKEVGLDDATLKKIIDAVNSTAPKKVVLNPESINEIKKIVEDNGQKAYEENQKFLVQIGERVERTLKAAVPDSLKALKNDLEKSSPWLSVVFFTALIIVLLALIVFVYKVYTEIKDKRNKNRSNDHDGRRFGSNRQKGQKVKSKKNKINSITLMPNAGEKDFSRWVDQNKSSDPDKELKCFRCGEKVKAKNMKRHIYERCEAKPKWAGSDKDELKIQNGKNYKLKV